VVESSREIANRGHELCRELNINEPELYGYLASDAAQRNERQEAFDWIAKGRSVHSDTNRRLVAPIWDMLEIQVRMVLDTPEDWVPELAVVLDRYGSDKAAMMLVQSRLISLGLIRVVPDPENPEEFALDPSLLQYFLSLYGPRITTSSGVLGVSASKGEIWTPGSSSGGTPLWTPGSGEPAAPASSDRPRLILPGS
jgi:hypothetical protein